MTNDFRLCADNNFLFFSSFFFSISYENLVKNGMLLDCNLCIRRIGFAIAKRLAEEGAKVMISSRKENNVFEAVEKLKKEGLDVSGVVCHVGKAEDRARLFSEVKTRFLYIFRAKEKIKKNNEKPILLFFALCM